MLLVDENYILIASRIKITGFQTIFPREAEKKRPSLTGRSKKRFLG